MKDAAQLGRATAAERALERPARGGQGGVAAGRLASLARLLSGVHGALATALPLLAVLGIGAAARWPNLWHVPTFTDETAEVGLAYAIYRGETAPLTNVEPYIGAFWNYLLAAGFWAVGLSPWLPRLLVFLAGVATVGATWWLGRELGGRRGGPIAGAVAGLFMAGCSTHALVNSHVAWSHATTPLWATLGLACLARALRREASASSGRWLVGAGLFLGLALQTHITAILLLPGAGLTLLLQRGSLLRTRWALFGALAFLLATANLLAFNVMTAGGSLRGGQQVLADYTGQDDGLDAGDYRENVGRLILASSWIVSGTIEKRRFVGETLAQPLLLAYLALALGGLAWAARRGRWLPVLVAVPYLLALPMLQGKYEPMLNGRYVVPVLPLVFAGIGLGAADAVRCARRRWLVPGPLVGGLVLGLVALAALYPLAPMAAYQQTARTNHPVIAAYEAVLADRAPGEVVVLDYGLDGVFFMAAGSAFKSMELLLGGSDVPYVVIDARASSVEEVLGGHESRLIVLNTEKQRSLGRSFTLTALMGGERDGPGFGVFRVSARP